MQEKNYGRIFIETPYEVCMWMFWYTNIFRTVVPGRKRITGGTGIKRISCVHFRKHDRNSGWKRKIESKAASGFGTWGAEYYLLIQAHIYLYGEKKKKQDGFLENFNYNRFAIGKTEISATTFSWLHCLRGRDTSHTNRVLEELNRLYIKYRISTRQLLCMLVNLDRNTKVTVNGSDAGKTVL